MIKHRCSCLKYWYGREIGHTSYCDSLYTIARRNARRSHRYKFCWTTTVDGVKVPAVEIFERRR